MADVNVLLIDCHDLGDHLGCYGRDYGQSPNLDRLAAEGVRLANYFATAPQCMPSRTSALTACYPEELGVYGQNPPDRPALFAAEHFRRQGYATRLWGGLNLEVAPADAGYEQHHAMPQTASEVAACLPTSEGRPFFVHAGFGLVHRPFGAEFEPELAGRVEVPPVLPDCAETRRDLAAFYRNVRRLDERVGLLLAGLQAAGRAQNTLVVFTTDHGPAFARAKHTLYDPGLRIAAIFRLPDALAGGAVQNGLRSNIGMLPTLCELTGLPALAGLRGTGGTREHAFAAITWTRRTGQLSYHPTRCVRTARHKLIRNFTPDPFYLDSGWLARFGGDNERIASWPYFGRKRSPVELYDLEADPDETQDLAGRPELREVQAAMQASLDAHLHAIGDPILDGPVPNPTGEPVKQQWVRQGNRYRLDFDPESEARERPFPAP